MTLHSKLHSLVRLGTLSSASLVFPLACTGGGENPSDEGQSETMASTMTADDTGTASGMDGNTEDESGTTGAETSGNPDASTTDSESADDTASDSGDESGSACGVTPGDWSAPDWATNTSEALALRAQLEALTGAMTMRGAEQGMGTVDDVGDLTTPFEAGRPSLADITSAGFTGVIDNAFAEFVDVIAAGTKDLIDEGGQWTPGTSGGIFGSSTRGFNEGGLEVRQLVDKGLFAGAGLYNYALGRTAGTIDAATIDALAAAWGSNETLDPMGMPADSAGYTYEMGFHARAANALAAAKAYAADPQCLNERDEAIRSFFNTWEQAMAARLVYYANVAVTATASATMDDDFAGALHELAEGAGLVLGFHGLEAPATGPMSASARIITDKDLANIMDALGIDITDLGASSTGEFVENVPNFEAAVTAVEAVVADVYGLTADDVQSYRMPTPG